MRSTTAIVFTGHRTFSCRDEHTVACRHHPAGGMQNELGGDQPIKGKIE
jgi:hypothetical protein